MKRALQISLVSFFFTIISCSSYSQNTIKKEDIKRAKNLIPEQAFKGDVIEKEIHPLSDKINVFAKSQNEITDFEPLGLKKVGYLKIIDGQVRSMLKYQNSNGRIIDPIEKTEKYYTTPCFAHSVAILVASGYIKNTSSLAQSGIKALGAALSDMVNDSVNGNHGDFYTWPVMLAYENFKPFVSKDVLSSWGKSLQSIDISKLYEFYNKEHAINWILVHASGEFLRAKNKFTSHKYMEKMLGFQLSNFTKLGMYNEGGNPLAYDLFARHYLAGMLQLGYQGKYTQILKNNLWKGAWTSLFIQSPVGELPTGYRSSHHIWNEAEQCVLFEIYASAYAGLGKVEEASAFKRAAMLSLNSITKWIREDGSGYIVKNRFPIENKHGYERYSVHTCYNMLATSMLAQAWQFANDEIEEKPAPADIGGFVIRAKKFHKIFANANGTYLEYELKTDKKYNPTGIVRSHIKGSNPQLGPSNGVAPLFSGEGNYIATGPLWYTEDGGWTSLAETTPEYSSLEILEETKGVVKFKIEHDLTKSEDKPRFITEIISIRGGVITVETNFKGFEGQKRISWPMLVSDGENKVKSIISENAVTLELQDKNINFSVTQPQEVKLILSENTIKHVNGLAKGIYAEFSGDSITYKLQ